MLASSRFVYNGMLDHMLGEVSEWSIVRSWKDRLPHKGSEGSNPSLSDFFPGN